MQVGRGLRDLKLERLAILILTGPAIVDVARLRERGQRRDQQQAGDRERFPTTSAHGASVGHGQCQSSLNSGRASGSGRARSSPNFSASATCLTKYFQLYDMPGF